MSEGRKGYKGYCTLFSSKASLSLMKSFPGDKTYSKSSNPEFQKMASRYCPALTSEISMMKQYLKSEKEDVKTEK